MSHAARPADFESPGRTAAAYAHARGGSSARITASPVLGARARVRPSGPRIAEDPQKVYIQDQIQGLSKTNPAMVAQLIQTWMDEDRRN